MILAALPRPGRLLQRTVPGRGRLAGCRQQRGHPLGRLRERPAVPGDRPALFGTLQRAARRRPVLPLAAGPEDLRYSARSRPRGRLVVILTDTSDSMGEGLRARIAVAKGAVLSLLRSAYWHRDRVALITAGGREARLVLPPTRSIDLARNRLRRLPVGGATPLAAGLWQAAQLIGRERLRHPGLDIVLVVVSDGEANLPLRPGANIREELRGLAGSLQRQRLQTLVLDGRPPGPETAAARSLARLLGGRYLAPAAPGTGQTLVGLLQEQLD